MSATRDEINDIAHEYAAGGLSVIPIRVDGSKAPALASWDTFQQRPATDRQLYEWFGTAGVKGIAIIAGAVSGNLEVLDFDDPAAWAEWLGLIGDHDMTELANRLPIVETPSGGRHLFYRCADGIAGNQKLARASDRKVRIETRGEGGYVLAPGSPRACHPDNRPYTVRQGDLCAIPGITGEERGGLLAMARICNEYADPETIVGKPAPRRENDGGGLKPGEDYNARGDHYAVLRAHGWTHVGDHGGRGLWRRPGKTRGISATSNYANSDLFWPWTSNASPFEPERSYTRFGLYATLEHNGDFVAAAGALGKLGFGDPPKKPAPAPKPVKNGAKPAEVEAEPVNLRFFPHTDVGNAERLQALHGEDLRYCHELGQWYVWDGARWRTDRTGEINRRAVDMVRALYTEAGQEEDAAKRTELGKYARRCESRSAIESAIHICKSLKGIPATVDDFDADRLMVNAANGTIDLRTGELRPARRQDLMTKQIPVAYDPNAPCPAWDAFLEQILPDPDVRQFVQRAAGYSLTGEVIDECLIFLHGSGSNGKSTLVNTLLTMMGDYALQSAPDMLIAKDSKGGGANNDIARLFGQRLVVTSEPGESVRLAEGLVKQITSKDRITARFLHKEFFDFWPTHKTWFCANHKPQIRGADNGIWRRIKLIPFDVRIADEQKDTHLGRKLEADLPGILAWAVRGCLEWREHGLGEPAAVKAATDSYRGEMDVLKSFLEDCCIVRPSLSVVGTQLWTAYNQWCDHNAEKPVGKQTFGRRLQEAHAIVPGKNIGHDHARGWNGIGLRSDLTAEEIDKVDKVDTNSTFFSRNLFHEEKIPEIVSTMSTLSTTSSPQSDDNDGKKWGVI